MPEISDSFQRATSLTDVLEGTKNAPPYPRHRIDTFEGVPQVMTYGEQHPVMEALRSLLPGHITVGSFTHAAKYIFDIQNPDLLAALEDNLSCPIPDRLYQLTYGTFVGKHGEMVEDVLFYRNRAGQLVATGNLADRDVIYERLGAFAGNGLSDVTQDQAIFYAYGQGGRAFFQAVSGVDLDGLGWRGVTETRIGDIPAVLSATTYTPFRSGGEIQFSIDRLPEVWDYLHKVAHEEGMTLDACGLTGRDLARILGGLALGGADYRIPDCLVSPASFGIQMKAEDFNGRQAALATNLELRRIYVPSSAYRARIKAQRFLPDGVNYVTSGGFVPEADDLLARSNSFPVTLNNPDQVRRVISSLPMTPIVAGTSNAPMTGNHLFVVAGREKLLPGDPIVIAEDRRGNKIQGTVCSNLRAWPR